MDLLFLLVPSPVFYIFSCNFYIFKSSSNSRRQEMPQIRLSFTIHKCTAGGMPLRSATSEASVCMYVCVCLCSRQCCVEKEGARAPCVWFDYVCVYTCEWESRMCSTAVVGSSRLDQNEWVVSIGVYLYALASSILQPSSIVCLNQTDSCRHTHTHIYTHAQKNKQLRIIKKESRPASFHSHFVLLNLSLTTL